MNNKFIKEFFIAKADETSPLFGLIDQARSLTKKSAIEEYEPFFKALNIDLEATVKLAKSKKQNVKLHLYKFIQEQVSKGQPTPYEEVKAKYGAMLLLLDELADRGISAEKVAEFKKSLLEKLEEEINKG